MFYMKVVKGVNHKCSHDKEKKFFFYFFNIIERQMFTGPVVIISKLGWKEQFISLSTVDTRPDALRDGVLSTVGC